MEEGSPMVVGEAQAQVVAVQHMEEQVVPTMVGDKLYPKHSLG